MGLILTLASTIVFLLLFLFLLFIFSVVIASKLSKKQSSQKFQPNVSVVVPAFNEEVNIRHCLDSIKKSNYPEEKLEIILVDDGSSDRTAAIAAEYGIKIIKQDHLGKVEALNNGVKAASNEFILAVDADTVLEENCLKEIINPFLDKMVGATNCAIRVKNPNKSVLTMFQNMEYHYNNLIRNSFSQVCKNGIWFFGAVACYRKTSLNKLGLFKKDTITEDMDIAMEMKKNGYKTINVHNAVAYTSAPDNLKELYKQRARWWVGGLQTLVKNKTMFSSKYGISSIFLFINQVFWSIYALISLPLIIYQINYWLPYNSDTFIHLFDYFFRWFSLYGSLWVLYKIPSNGISYLSIFGVLSGILSTLMMFLSIKTFRDRLSVKNTIAIFFYFPYTIVLNIIIILSLFSFKLWKRGGYFVK